MSVANRVVVCAALCASLLACPKADVARPLDRPAPPTTGLADARVLYVDGNVEVTPPTGAPFIAKVGTDLVADDRIGASTSSKIVVVLRNGHAVRIDDAGALKVRDIVLFQAPQTERPVDEQLKELLDVGESLPFDEVRDRAAAWRQMLRAAETGGAESRDEAGAQKEAKVESAAAVSEKASEVAMSPPPAAQAMPSSDMPPPEPQSAPDVGDTGSGLGLQGVGAGGGGSGASGGLGIGSIGSAKKAHSNALEKDALKEDAFAPDDDASGDSRKDAPASRSKMRGEEGKMGKKDDAKNDKRVPMLKLTEEQARALTQPGIIGGLADSAAAPPLSLGFSARFGASAGEAQAIEFTQALTAIAVDLGKCVGRSLPASVTLSTADLLIEVRDGKSKRVRLSGALPVPLCARNVAVESAAAEIASTRGGSGWLVVTVPLSR